MTIHQPSARLYQLVDDLIFLAAGHVTYNGPANKLHDYINTVVAESTLGAVPEANPPETFLDVCDLLASENRLEEVYKNYSGDGDKNYPFPRSRRLEL